MGSIMLIIAVSRGLAIPKYLTDLGIITMEKGIVDILTQLSFIVMVIALLTGAIIILSNMIKGMKKSKEEEASHGKV
jgi:hypothetical protein